MNAVGPARATEPAGTEPARDATPPALEGDLRRFSAADVLQFLKLAGVTGRLECERAGERLEVAFDHGRPLWAQGSERCVRLGDVMLHRGWASAEDLRAALDEQHGRPGEPLGRLLRARGAAEAHVVSAAAEVFRRVVCLLSLWPDGRFRFVPGGAAGMDDAALDLELDRLILEGLLQADLVHGIA